MRVEINNKIRVDTYLEEMRDRLSSVIEEAKTMDGTVIVKEHDSDLFRFSIEVYDGSNDFCYELWFTYLGEVLW